MKRSDRRNYLEYLTVCLVLKTLALLPRALRLQTAYLLAKIAYLVAKKLKKTAAHNLEMALPELSRQQHAKIIKGLFRNFGRLLAEFSYFPKYTKEEIEQAVEYSGLENYLAAHERGHGVLFLTGHFGAWELSCFFHAMCGYPHNILVRKIDNPYIEALVDSYRSRPGNRTIDKNNSAKAILSCLRRGETVGILIDLNTVRNQGVFCDFFGIPACSTTGLATLALRTDAAVVPVVIIWDEQKKRHILHFEPALEIISTGNLKEDILQNTSNFNKVLESFIRKHPDHWLWVHKRWKTRPEGEPEIY
ncbi:MAG: lysophospholipid acyltransferase family protein [Blastocatellia bacterium]|nr:lysophospholipid acyltransferase family protein [Blastocatellia bacterium]